MGIIGSIISTLYSVANSFAKTGANLDAQGNTERDLNTTQIASLNSLNVSYDKYLVPAITAGACILAVVYLSRKS